MLLRVALLVCVSLVALPAPATEGEWSRFRGPNGSGLSNAKTVPVRWTESDYNWKVELPGVGHSSPVVWKDRIFLMSSDGEAAVVTVLCLHAYNGRKLWGVDFPSKKHRQHPDNSLASATPAVDEHGVVVSWSTPESLVLAALDLDGGEMWKRDLGPYIGGHGSGQSPIIVGNLVVLANDQEDPKRIPEMYGENPKMKAGASSLISVDRKTGEDRWTVKRRTELSAYSTPCVRALEGGASELIFSSTAHGISAIDSVTGEVNWEIDDVFEDRCVGSPVLSGDLVIAGFGTGLYGTRCVAVKSPDPGSKAQPQVVYDVKRSVPLVPSPLVKGDRLFLWSDMGIVTSLVVSTGEEVWRKRVDGDFYASPICVEDRLYCVSKAGEVVVVSTSDEFQELARVPLGELCFTTPAVADGVLYLRSESHLYSIGGEDRTWGLNKSNWQDVSFTAKCDATEQKYAMLLPQGFDPSKDHDLLVMFHGMYGDRWQLHQLSHHGPSQAMLEVAQENDLIVVTPDYRLDEWMGPRGEADSLQIIEEIKGKYGIRKVFISGGSMGGSAVLTLAVLHPNLFDGVLSFNGTANYLEYPNYQDYIQKGFGGTKSEIPLEYKNRSAEYWPERFVMPVGIVVGNDDGAVPPHSCRRLADVLKKLSRDVLFIGRDNIGHGATYEDARAVFEFVLGKSKEKAARELPEGSGG